MGALPKLEPGELMQTPCQVPELRPGQQLLPEEAPFIMRLGSLAAQAAAAFISGGAGVCFGCLISISELRPCEI